MAISPPPAQAAPAAALQRWHGAAPPAFSLLDTRHRPIGLAGTQGPVVLVHFFATWCEPCRDELPALNRLASRSHGAVKILAISVAEPDRRVEGFLESVPLDFPILLDRDRAVAKNWNVVTLPTTVVLDESLQPRLIAEGDFAWDGTDAAALSAAMAAAARPGSLSPSSLSNDTTPNPITKPQQTGE